MNALIRLVGLLAGVAQVCAAAQAGGAQLAKTAPIPPCPAVIADAQAQKIPLEGFDPPARTNAFRPGDSITALLTLCEKNSRRTQWLLHVQAVAPTAKELAAKPAPNMTLYSSIGSKLDFVSAPAWVNLQILGPFEASPSAKRTLTSTAKTARLPLNQGFLSLGLDQGAKTIVRLMELAPKLQEAHVKGAYVIGSAPFGEAVVRSNQTWVKITGMTSQEEHALTGICPALFSYLGIVHQTPGLQEILFKLIDLPTVWSMARHAGIKPNLSIDSEHVRQVDISASGLPLSSSAYELPIQVALNERPALRLTFLVTAPQPPLLGCAGVVSLLAENPSDPELYLTFRVLCGRRGDSLTVQSNRSDLSPPRAVASGIAGAPQKQ